MDHKAGAGKGTVGRGVGRFTLAALLLWLLILDIVLIVLAANAFNKFINTGKPPGSHPSNISMFVLLFSLIDGGFIGAGVLLGLSHVYLYNAGSVGPAFTAAVYSWGINLLTLGLVCKEIKIGGQQGHEKAIEYLVFIIGFFATIYVLILFGALHHPNLGVGYHSSPV